jgi:hypothetical protein
MVDLGAPETVPSTLADSRTRETVSSGAATVLAVSTVDSRTGSCSRRMLVLARDAVAA